MFSSPQPCTCSGGGAAGVRILHRSPLAPAGRRQPDGRTPARQALQLRPIWFNGSVSHIRGSQIDEDKTTATVMMPFELAWCAHREGCLPLFHPHAQDAGLQGPCASSGVLLSLEATTVFPLYHLHGPGLHGHALPSSVTIYVSSKAPGYKRGRRRSNICVLSSVSHSAMHV